MKYITLPAIIISSAILFSCSEANTEPRDTNTNLNASNETTSYSANVKKSSINWKGEVAGIYSHIGTIDLQSGSLTFNGDQISGGEFVVDMTSISPTDNGTFKDQDGGRISDLQGHLSTEDFFATATYPTSKFVITSVEGNIVTGNLTIRDKTNEESFEISLMERDGNDVKIEGSITFDRQKYDVAWVHYMKDMILSDDIVLTINLLASK